MISTVMLFIVTLVVGILFYRVMVGFFVPLFLAALLVVIFRPVHEWVLLQSGNKPRAAALTTCLLILLAVLLPAVGVMGIAAAQGTAMISRLNYNNLAFAIQRTRVQLGLEIKNIVPFVRLPELIAALGQVDELPDARTTRQTRDKLREYEQLLRVLESDFASQKESQKSAFQRVRDVLDELDKDIDALAADSVEANKGTSSNPGDDAASNSSTVDEVTADEATVDEATVDDPEDGPSELAAEVVPSDVESAAADQDVAVTEGEEVTATMDFRSPAERYHRTLVRLDSVSRQLNSELLGGDIWAQLKLMANPTDDKVKTVIGQLQTYIQPKLVSVTSATGEFLLQTAIGLAILIVALYFFLVDGPGMVRTLMRLSPLDDRYEQKLLAEFDRTSRAVVLATVLSALAQGILASLGYYFCGLGSIVLLFFLTTFMALIPFFGAASVWAPCCIWLGFVEERWGPALALAFYGALVVSSIDNVIKVFVLHGRSQLHPLLALLSVLGGVQVFGPIGILVGPMVVVFLQTTLEILNHELSRYEAPSEDAERELLVAAATGVSVEAVADKGTTAGAAVVPEPNKSRPTPKKRKG
jgi:predicted PurR-regulated permease PerM